VKYLKTADNQPEHSCYRGSRDYEYEEDDNTDITTHNNRDNAQDYIPK
jgi:hypothetical protein